MWPFKKRDKTGEAKDQKNVMVVGKWKVHLNVLKQQMVNVCVKIVLNKYIK
ncbi:hypothetical protein [Spiroplasma ixodetis]|uniref:hypothetical protein n=1 Tax=Spiroplasma ixodetis TaxID=2141 RepID=UPI0024915D34|nr:hypothetical protein [Spiroplasma ixodetis]